MALPALRAVRARFPEARIAIVARPYVADLYRGQKICDELISYDPKGAHKGLSGRERLAQELRAQKFDVALLLQNAFDAAWLAWRAGVNATRIAIGAGASYGSAKCWPPKRFADFVNRLRLQTDADVILFGTAAEQKVSDAIAAGIKGPSISLVGKTAIADLPALLSRCQLFVGNDSGAMHVAAAVGLPVVAIFGPTDPHGTAPITPRCTVVQEKPYCSPCFLRRCPIDHRCMTSVRPEAVEAAARGWLRSAEVASG